MYHLTTSSTIPYLYITQLVQPSFSLHFTRPYQCIILLPAVPFCICTLLSSSNQPSFSSTHHQAIPVYHFTKSSTILYLYITQPFQSALFLISTSLGHTSVSPYYQQYHSISVHHSALFLISTSPGHTSVSPYYQQYHSISVHHSALPISPLSHLHFTRPYQCIILLPAVPFCICTSLSLFNQPSFSSPLHQAIPVYHLTTSSTILYLYITQPFQSAFFLISTSLGHTSVSPYYQQYHSIYVHHSALPISHLSLSTSPGHTSVSSYYQQYHSVSVHYSALPISPLSHLHITRPY